MRRIFGIAAITAVALVGMPTPVRALSLAPDPLTVFASPSAIPAGNTFTVSGHCLEEGAKVTIELVRQARPGRAAQVVQRRVVTQDSERGYSTTFTNNLTAAPAFPVDAQVFAQCGKYTAHRPFVSTNFVYPRPTAKIVTIQADGPCGTCVAHVKGFDAFANLSTSYNYYLKDWTRSGSIDAVNYSADYTPLTFGTGAGKRAQVGQAPFALAPYGDFMGGVEVVSQDVLGDAGSEMITAPGPGGGPHVKVFNAQQDPNTPYYGIPNWHVDASFFAYAPEFTGGVRLAVGDVLGDAKPEIITVPGPGGGPHVRIFSATGQLLGEFLAYAPNVTGGLSVAVGDVVAGGKREIVTGAGPGGAAHVKTFTGTGQPIGSGFYAYDESFTGGVWVAAGDVDGQGADDIVTGAGAGGWPHVRIFESPEGAAFGPGFFAYEDLPTGVRVAVARKL